MFKKIKYFTLKAYRDISNPLIYKINKNNNNEKTLKEYYFYFDTDELLAGGSYEFKFDKNGVPLVKGHVSDTDGSYFYQPQAIGQFSLALFHDYLKNENISTLDRFLNLALWFKNNYKENQGIPYWESTVNKLHHVYGEDQKGQVISSMSQSRAISVLLRAYQESNEIEYIKLAEKALLAYKKNPIEGGFLDNNDKGDIFFEEVSQPRILNHLIFSVFGLYDYCRIKKFNTKYYDLFQKSIATIKKYIHQYDTGWWSLYDNYYENGVKRVNPCTRHYHNIHIQQLLVLYSITGDEMFKQYYKKWLKYDQSNLKRIRMLYHKMKTVKRMGRI